MPPALKVWKTGNTIKSHLRHLVPTDISQPVMGSRWVAWPSSPSNSEQHPGWRRMGRSQVHQPLGLLHVRGAETPQEGAQGVVGPLEGRRALSVLRTKCRPPGGHWEDRHRQQQRLAEAAPKPHFREESFL